VPARFAAVPNTYALQTLRDALRLRACLRPDRVVAVVGGGFIGCEVAATARQVGCDVALIEAGSGLLERSLGAAASILIQDLHSRHGVEVMLGSGLAEASSGPGGLVLRLETGRVVRCDLAVYGLGVRPNSAWLEGSDIAVQEGIACDTQGRTSLPDVWALGDVASWSAGSPGPVLPARHWTSATIQARLVAASVLGRERPVVDTVPYFWSDQYDVKIQSFGHVDPTAPSETACAGPGPVVLYARDSRLQAAVGFGVPRVMAELKSLIGRSGSLALARLACSARCRTATRPPDPKDGPRE
jgi:3-phenylpropionate/trans-cinnamate dioxygenase ferredoxin reductase subunit